MVAPLFHVLLIALQLAGRISKSPAQITDFIIAALGHSHIKIAGCHLIRYFRKARQFFRHARTHQKAKYPGNHYEEQEDFT